MSSAAVHEANMPQANDKMPGSRFGARILEGMGWSEGTGLGAKRDGITEPLSVKRRKENIGLGAERRPFKDAWWEKMMDDVYGKPKDARGGAKKEEDLLDACEGRRCRPHGKSKLDRLAKQDLAIASTNSKPKLLVLKSELNETEWEPKENEWPVSKLEMNIDISQSTVQGSAKFLQMAETAGVTVDAKYVEKLDNLLEKQRLAEIEGIRGLDGTLLTDETKKRERRKILSRKVRDAEKKIMKVISKKQRHKEKSNKKREEALRAAVDSDYALERLNKKRKRAEKLAANALKREKRNIRRRQEKVEKADDSDSVVPTGC